MIIFTTCKINIGLNVTRRRTDGYHDLETLMVPVDWGDIIEIVPSRSSETTLTVMGRAVDCTPEKNLVMRAYRALSEVSPLPPVDIYLDKIVPDGAGLGGGSADASFTLKALNDMFALGMTSEQLAAIAATLGADCPLFVYNRPMFATGTGTTLQPASIDMTSYHILIVKPPVKVSTREAYGGVTPAPWEEPLESLLGNITATRPANDFETSVFALHPELSLIKQRLYDFGAVYASMSGSGSALFGLFLSLEDAEKASRELEDCGMCHICHAV